jgi:hypothetical protein
MKSDGTMSFDPVLIGGKMPDPAKWNSALSRTVITIDDGKLIVYNPSSMFVHDWTTKKETSVKI